MQMSRRAFLVLGGTATLVTGVLATGVKALFDSGAEATAVADSQAAVAQQASGVACPHGLVNDPYPGRCRHYRDSDGDGICDYSVAGSGSNQSAAGDGSLDGALSGQPPGGFGHRPGSGQP